MKNNEIISQKAHGIDISLPQGWSDHTIYKFAAPEGAEIHLPSKMAATKKPENTFRSNLIVTKHQVPSDVELRDVLTTTNRPLLENNPTFRIAAQGDGVLGAHKASWQDVTFFESRAKVQILQRQIAVRAQGQDVIMLTLTTGQATLTNLVKELALEVKAS